MLCYNRIETSKGIDGNKTNASKKCIICHFSYFLHKGFMFQPTVRNGGHDILLMTIDIRVLLF